MFAVAVAFGNPGSPRPVIVTVQKELKDFNFLARDSVSELVSFFVRETAGVVEPFRRYPIVHEKCLVCVWKSKQPPFTYFVFCPKDFPQSVAFRCLQECEKLMGDFYAKATDVNFNSPKDLNLKVPGLKELLAKYRQPENVSQLHQALAKVEETKDAVAVNLKTLLANEDLDKLVEQSEDLKGNTKLFMKNTEKMNKCC